jgi:WD40 repeat protein
VEVGSGVDRIAFSPGGDLLLTTGSDTSAQVWKTATGEKHRTLRGHEQSVRHAVFSPDGRSIATASADHTVRLWDLETGEGRALRGHTDAVNRVLFSPDGAAILSAGTDGTVRIWPDNLPRDPADLRAWLREKSR